MVDEGGKVTRNASTRSAVGNADPSRVMRIRAAIADGSYVLDTAALARALVGHWNRRSAGPSKN